MAHLLAAKLVACEEERDSSRFGVDEEMLSSIGFLLDSRSTSRDV